jgi:hypothetical protein
MLPGLLSYAVYAGGGLKFSSKFTPISLLERISAHQDSVSNNTNQAPYF